MIINGFSSLSPDELAVIRKRKKLYYMKFRMKHQDEKIRIYQTLRAVHEDMSNILKNGGVVLGVANVSSQYKPMTEYSFKLSGI